MKTRPIDPAAFDSKLSALDSRRIKLEAERGEALDKLAVFPDDAEANRLAAALEDELTGIAKERSRLLEARDRAAAQYSDEQRRAFAAQLAVDAKNTDELVVTMTAQVTDICKQITRLGPQLERVHDLATEHAALVWGITRAAGMKRSAIQDITPAFAALIEHALHDAGMDAVVPIPRNHAVLTPETIGKLRGEALSALYSAVRSAAEALNVPDPVPATKTIPSVTLVAIERGRIGDRLIEIGERFVFDPTPTYPGGSAKPLPRWAKSPSEADAILKHRSSLSHDIKPKAATRAVTAKGNQTRDALHS